MVPLIFERRKFKQGYLRVVGTDEVGRGCLAGPVVAAAVMFDAKLRRPKELRDVNDSKMLKASVREKLAETIKRTATAWSVGVVPPGVIDKVNIHHAGLRAMQLSVNKIVSMRYDEYFLFVDGKFLVPGIGPHQEAVVGGDAKIFTVACASIIAKVYRDNLMQKLHVKLPCYGFNNHKGYATLQHRQAILEYGVSEYHRKTFCKKF